MRMKLYSRPLTSIFFMEKTLFILHGFISVFIKTLQVFHLIFIYNYLLINDLYPF
jgi:hypothetical protein